MMRAAMEKGQWVFFQNCHLSPSWMPSLERLVEQVDPDHVSIILVCTTIISSFSHIPGFVNEFPLDRLSFDLSSE
jgi:hypothetical protein